MEPFRALVADLLPESQRSYGFVVQTLIIGIGTWLASQLPKFLTGLGVSNEAPALVIPANVKMAFLIGGIVYMLSILYTILTTKEYPPEDMDAFREEIANSKGFFHGVKEIFSSIVDMPTTMKKLGIVQFLSWFAFFTMWSMATPALTEHVFSSPKPDEGTMSAAAYAAADLAYNNAADAVSSAMGVYGLTSMVFALVLTFVTSKVNINRKWVHLISCLLYTSPSPRDRG